MTYQDAWIRGEVTRRGDRACADRYGLIREVVKPFTRQITAWDLGANLGYFGCRLADEFNTVSVMVEPRSDLVGICKANGLPTTIAMTHRLTVEDLAQLGACVHADVILALNVLHHIADWKRALAAVLEMGEAVIIETPGRGDKGSANYPETERILDAIEDLRPQVIGMTKSHVTPGVERPVFLIRRTKSALRHGYCYIERVRKRGAHTPRPHVIESSLHAKRITYQDGESRDWYPGVNLWNWVQLAGSYPDRAWVKRAVTQAVEGFHGEHGDVRPWNLILQGRDVKVIDAGHRTSREDGKALRQTLEWIDTPEKAYVRAA